MKNLKKTLLGILFLMLTIAVVLPVQANSASKTKKSITIKAGSTYNFMLTNGAFINEDNANWPQTLEIEALTDNAKYDVVVYGTGINGFSRIMQNETGSQWVRLFDGLLDGDYVRKNGSEIIYNCEDKDVSRIVACVQVKKGSVKVRMNSTSCWEEMDYLINELGMDADSFTVPFAAKKVKHAAVQTIKLKANTPVSYILKDSNFFADHFRLFMKAKYGTTIKFTAKSSAGVTDVTLKYGKKAIDVTKEGSESEHYTTDWYESDINGSYRTYDWFHFTDKITFSANKAVTIAVPYEHAMKKVTK